MKQTPPEGRFLSVDPLMAEYPWYSPYQFAGNTPIQAIDLDGLEPKPVNDGTSEGQTQTTTEERMSSGGAGGTGFSYTAEKKWYWHAGSTDYNTKAGWYSEKDYQNVLTPIAMDLAGYKGLYTLAAGHNWTQEEKANAASTRLGKFVDGLGKDASTQLGISTYNYASNRKFFVTGFTEPSSFNVEDMLGVGILIKELSVGLFKFGLVIYLGVGFLSLNIN